MAAPHPPPAALGTTFNRGCDMRGRVLFIDHGLSSFDPGVFALGLIAGVVLGVLAVLLVA